MELTYFKIDGIQDVIENVLIKKLYPFEIYNATSDYNLFEKCLIFHMNSRLEKIFGKRYTLFKKILNDTNLVISGSFILQCIFGEDWNSDIDMILPDEENRDFINDVMFEHVNDYGDYINMGIISSVKNYYSIGMVDNISEQLKDQNNSDYIIDQIRKFPNCFYDMHVLIKSQINNTPTLQISNYDISNKLNKNKYIDEIYKCIESNYDFDVCSNLFYVEDGIDKVKISNFHGILNKKITLVKTNILTKEFRINKYMKRGFEFSNEELKNEIFNFRLSYGASIPKILIINDNTKEYYDNNYIKLENGIYLTYFVYRGDLIDKLTKLTIKKHEYFRLYTANKHGNIITRLIIPYNKYNQFLDYLKTL